MNRVKNEKILKVYRGNIRLIIIGVVIFLLSFVFFYLGTAQDSKDSSNIVYLNELIESSGDKTGKKAYLNISYLSPKVVVYDDTTDAYYLAADESYYYLVYMHEGDAKRISNKDLSNYPEKVIGSSKSIPTDVKNIVIEAYNKYLIEEGEEKIDSNTFYNVFGDVYLDTTDTFSSLASIYMLLGVCSFFTGILLLIIGIVFTCKFKKNINLLSEYDLGKIEGEMSDSTSFFYCNDKLCLTPNYLIMLDSKFKAYSYSDILWIFPFEQRYNGVRTNKAIKIGTSDGKIYMIANMGIATKAMQAVYDEVWNSIISKNSCIRVGYLPENISYFNEVKKTAKYNK